MADNYLITGYHGTPHVTAENDRGIYAGIFGAGRFVLPVGEQFRAEYIGNNTVRVYDGKLIDNGAAAGIPAGKYVDLTVTEAAQGMNRNDLIVFQYKKNTATLVESGEFVVVKGAETVGTATDPALTQADLLTDEATLDQMALWRVKVSTATISAPVKVFEVRSLSGTPDSEKRVAYAETAGTANKAKASMTIRANGGQTEGTNKWTYNGSTSKAIDITPESIGAAKAVHEHTASEVGAAEASHKHSASDINSGTLELDRLPLGDIVALHVWEKHSGNPNGYSLGADVSANFGTTIYYSEKIEIVNGEVLFVNSTRLTGNKADDFNQIKGKFVCNMSSPNPAAGQSMYYVSPNATIVYGGSTVQANPVNKVTPNPNNSNMLGYVTSKENNAYPANGTHTDGCWYVYSKQLCANEHTSGTADLTPGTSALKTGTYYWVYE